MSPKSPCPTADRGHQSKAVTLGGPAPGGQKSGAGHEQRHGAAAPTAHGTAQFTPPACRARRGVPVSPPAGCWERVPWQKDKLPSHSKQATVTHPTARGTPQGTAESPGKDAEWGSNAKEIGWSNSGVRQAPTGPRNPHPTLQARARQLPGGSRAEAKGRRGTGLPNPSNLLAQ